MSRRTFSPNSQPRMFLAFPISISKMVKFSFLQCHVNEACHFWYSYFTLRVRIVERLERNQTSDQIYNSVTVVLLQDHARSNDLDCHNYLILELYLLFSRRMGIKLPCETWTVPINMISRGVILWSPIRYL